MIDFTKYKENLSVDAFVSIIMDNKIEATTPLSWTLFTGKRSLHIVKPLK